MAFSIPPESQLLSPHPEYILFGLLILSGTVVTLTLLAGFAATLPPRKEPSLYGWPFTTQFATFGLTCTIIGSGFLFATSFSGLLMKVLLAVLIHLGVLLAITEFYQWRKTTPTLPDAFDTDINS